LKTIAKNRKKKEQEALANATKLTEVQEEQVNEIPQPTANRVTTPLPVKGKSFPLFTKPVDFFLFRNYFT